MDDDEARELEALEGILIDPSAEPIKLSYGLLKSVTDNFSNEIGHGGFGVVYMGVLQNGDVAVKKLSNPHELSDKQFLDEITCLKKAKHKNTVRFLGYCSETQGELLEFNGRNIMAEVQKKLLCFEYVSNGNIQHYLQEKPREDDWPVRYKMIRGICQGLHYLHEKNINHLDLKPENVMLDAQMEPKITDFGLSRCLDQGKSMVTQRLLGTPRYIAPEIIDKGKISFKSDIYALGIIIIELLTGISRIDLGNWDESLDMDCPRVLRCTEIARICTDPDRHNRPTMKEVISELDELESMIPWPSTDQLPVNPAVAFPGTKLLDVYPLQLKFPFVPNQEICCHLTLTNKTDGIVIFNIPDRYRDEESEPTLPPMCSAAITLHRKAEEELPSDTEDKFEIQMLITGYHDEDHMEEQLSTLSLDEDVSFEDGFKAAHELLGLELHRAMLTAVVVVSKEDNQAAAFEVMHTTSISQEEAEEDETVILCMDVHPTEPWVLIVGWRSLYIWNWQTKKRTEACKEHLTDDMDRPKVAKFIARRQWAVIGNPDGSILVFMCPTMDQVKEFKAHTAGVTSLEVHPTRPFLLTCSYEVKSIKLWDWSNDWSCTRIFDMTSRVKQVRFHPMHGSTFVTLDENDIAMTWRIGRCDPIAAMELPDKKHAECFTYTGHRHHIAVACSKFLYICDLQGKKLIHTLYTGKKTRAVVCHPTRPVFVTASKRGSIRVWDSTTFRLKKAYLNLPKEPRHIGFTGSKRLVIGYYEGILVMDIDLE